MAELPPYPGAPRWVKITGVVTGILALLLVLMLAGAGGHGGGHGSPGEMGAAAGGHGRWGLPILLVVLLLGSMALNSRWLAERSGRSGRGSMSMPPRWRKLVLVAHVSSAVAALGAVAVFLALAIAGLASDAADIVRAAYVANALIAWYVILPLLIVSLLIGVGQAICTPWGLFRHYWVVVKLALTIVTLYVLLQQMEAIGHLAEVAASTKLSASDLLGLRRSVRFHAAGGLAVLLLLVALSIYKPRGLTRYGWRKQYEAGAPA